MPLQVIGAGIGRTGTTSLKLALEALGYDGCYHMEEFVKRPDDDEVWLAAVEGVEVDWEGVFQDFEAAVDLPTYVFYEELMQFYPEARVILTLRDPESWYESASRTIFRLRSRAVPRLLAVLSLFGRRGRNIRRVLTVARRVGLEDFFGGDVSKENAIRVFREHNEKVRRRVPPERLLEYEVDQGWEPLCEFLGVPVPEVPFPHANTREEFGSSSGG